MEYVKPHSRDYTLAVAALFLGSFVTFADLYSTQPIIPALSKEFQVSPAAGSLSLSVATGALAVFMLITPALSDLKGRKLVMTVSLAFTGIFSILSAFTPGFNEFLIARFFQGIFLAGFPCIAMGYINEVFHPDTSGLVMGIYISGNSIGGMSGRFVAGALTDLFSWHIAFLVLGVISVLISVLFWKMLPEPQGFHPGAASIKKIIPDLFHNLRDPGLLRLYFMGFILMGGFVTLYNYIAYPLMAPPYNLSQTIVGFIFVVYLTGTFSSTWMGGMADRTRRSRVLAAGIVLMLAGSAITLSSVLFIKLIGLAVFTFGFFGGHSVASSWVGKNAGNNKAHAASLYLLFYYMGSSLIGSTGGLFWSHYGWPGVILCINILLLVALPLSYSIPDAEAQNKVPYKYSPL